MNALGPENNFLAIDDPEFCSLEKSDFVIQQVPYEYTSSYHAGSAKGPEAIVKASQYVELYDEELDRETCLECGIATMPPMDFKGKVDEEAIKLIEDSTSELLAKGKTVVSLGAEHTVTLGFVRGYRKHFKNFAVLQIDAHSDLRDSYNGNKYSHASVMARIHELGIPMVQVGIRAQCIEEAELIKSSTLIKTFYAHHIRKNITWMEDAVKSLPELVYITIDADGFDPSVIPAVGTAEPNGLFWNETLEFLKMVCTQKKVIGFDVVECAPIEGTTLSEFTLAKLIYRLIGYMVK